MTVDEIMTEIGNMDDQYIEEYLLFLSDESFRNKTGAIKCKNQMLMPGQRWKIPAIAVSAVILLVCVSALFYTQIRRENGFLQYTAQYFDSADEFLQEAGMNGNIVVNNITLMTEVEATYWIHTEEVSAEPSFYGISLKKDTADFAYLEFVACEAGMTEDYAARNGLAESFTIEEVVVYYAFDEDLEAYKGCFAVGDWFYTLECYVTQENDFLQLMNRILTAT